MSRSQTGKNNSLLGGQTIANDLYAEPENYNEVFANLEKQNEVVPEPRKFFLRPGVLTTAKGSAYMEYGNTKVLAIVTPPRELTKSNAAKRTALGVINCFVNFAAFATRDLESVPQREKHLSSALRKSLEPMLLRGEFAGYQVDVRALVLDDDGCVLSTAINCCGVALVECGISVYDLLTSSSACLYRGQIFINPDLEIEKLLTYDCSKESSSEEQGIVTTACMTNFEQVAECYQTGFMSTETCFKLIDYTVEINKLISKAVSQILISRVNDQYEIDLREKAEEALEDQRLEDLIKLMQESKVKMSGNTEGKATTKTSSNA